MSVVTVTLGISAGLESAAARPGGAKDEDKKTKDEGDPALDLLRPYGALPFVLPLSSFAFRIGAALDGSNRLPASLRETARNRT